MQRKVWNITIILAVACTVYFLLPSSCPEAARRTAFVFTIAAALWALEIIPLYATSILVILLLTFLLAKPGGVLGMDASGYKIFLAPFASPVMMLFFGGFVLAVGVITALLWLTSTWHHIPESVTALVCVGVLTSFGLFTHQDLKHINWDILVLMWGGIGNAGASNYQFIGMLLFNFL